MRRAVHLFPNTRAWPFIEDLRSRFDPLHVLIAAHVTLVFPFESEVADEALVAHCREQAAKVEPFTFTVGRQVRSADDHYWLPVLPVPVALIDLRARLCSGLLAEWGELSGEYLPHITVGRPPLRAGIENAMDREAWRFPIALEAGAITIERIMEDQRSEVVERIGLGR